MARQPRGFLQEASHQVVAGGSAGLVEICLMHPLDVVKTRFQIQRGKTDPTSYKSLGDCFRTIFQREGNASPDELHRCILPTPRRELLSQGATSQEISEVFMYHVGQQF